MTTRSEDTRTDVACSFQFIFLIALVKFVTEGRAAELLIRPVYGVLFRLAGKLGLGLCKRSGLSQVTYSPEPSALLVKAVRCRTH